MVGAYYAEVAPMSSGLSSKTIGPPCEASDILPGLVMARTQRAVKYLNDAMRDAGNPSVPEVCRRAKKNGGYTLAVGTARDILSGKSESPEIGSLEALAAALKRPALELISKYLKDQPEPIVFEDSALAELWKLYLAARAAGHRDEADNSIRFLTNALRGLK